MVDNVLIAYVKTDQKDARMIAQMDDRTNEYFDSIYKHAVEAMKANPETVISGTDYLHGTILGKNWRLCHKYL